MLAADLVHDPLRSVQVIELATRINVGTDESCRHNRMDTDPRFNQWNKSAQSQFFRVFWRTLEHERRGLLGHPEILREFPQEVVKERHVVQVDGTFVKVKMERIPERFRFQVILRVATREIASRLDFDHNLINAILANEVQVIQHSNRVGDAQVQDRLEFLLALFAQRRRRAIGIRPQVE